MKIPTIKTTIVLTLAAGLFSTLQAGPIDAIYAFGDSLSDVGNVFALTGVPAPPYAAGQFSNGNVWVQDLAASLGLAPLQASRLGGTDYAYGTGETGVTSFNTSLPETDLLGTTGQIAQFEATHSTADPNALYTIWFGSNDLDDMLANAPPSEYAADLGIIAGNIDAAINGLAGLGAKNFLVVNVPDLGITPAALTAGPAASAGATAVSALFDSVLADGAGPIPSLPSLAAGDSINISLLNSFALVDAIVADPAVYGFTNVTQPCLTGEVNYAGGTPCANPGQYLFWDDIHPTAAAHELLAAEALSLVTPEPASFWLTALAIAAALFGIIYRADFTAKRWSVIQHGRTD